MMMCILQGRIFVAKIPRTVTEDEFKEYFSEYGVVNDAYMPRDRTQRYYRGIGFITFENEDSANKVMAIKHRYWRTCLQRQHPFPCISCFPKLLCDYVAQQNKKPSCRVNCGMWFCMQVP